MKTQKINAFQVSLINKTKIHHIRPPNQSRLKKESRAQQAIKLFKISKSSNEEHISLTQDQITGKILLCPQNINKESTEPLYVGAVVTESRV